MKKINYKYLTISFLIVAIIFTFNLIFLKGNTEYYNFLIKPKLAPDFYIFFIVWIVNYILLAISSYLIFQSQSDEKSYCLLVYGLQLIFSTIWPILFFTYNLLLTAFIWSILYDSTIIYMFTQFKKSNKLSSYLLLPIIAWSIFITLINIGIYALNI